LKHSVLYTKVPLVESRAVEPALHKWNTETAFLSFMKKANPSLVCSNFAVVMFKVPDAASHQGSCGIDALRMHLYPSPGDAAGLNLGSLAASPQLVTLRTTQPCATDKNVFGS
jgi:hypothetical protein